MGRSALGLVLMLAALSLLLAGIAGMSLFGPRTFGADDNGKNVSVNLGDTFWLRLPENPTTGYAWDLQLSDGLIKLSDKYEPADRSGLRVGVGGTRSFEIKAMMKGSQRVAGSYRQVANQSSEGLETYQLNVNVAEGGPLSGLLRLSLPVLADGTPGLSDQPGGVTKMLIRPADNKSMIPTRPPLMEMPEFSIIQTGMSVPPLPAARNQKTPQDIPLSYTDVPLNDAINANVGDRIRLSLPENPSTGYSWQMTYSDGVEQVGDRFTPGNSGTLLRPLVGAGGTREWTLKVTKPGTQTISGVYKRPWEGSSADEKTYALNVNVA